jgi:hypothetical protein
MSDMQALFRPFFLPSQVNGQALFWSHTLISSLLSVFLSLSLSSVPGQRCGPWAQSAGILRDSDTLSNTVLTLMAEIEFDKIFHVV